MMNQGRDFSDASTDALEYKPLPPGNYLAVATEISDDATKKGDGRMFKIKFEIAKGEYAKRVIFGYFIYQHPNETARNIGRAKLRLFCEATTGKPVMNEALALNKALTLKLDIEEGDRGPQNSIKSIAGPQGFPQPQNQAAMSNVTGAAANNLDNIPFG